MIAEYPAEQIGSRVIQDCIPQELKSLPQHVLWKLIAREGSNKPTKVPYSALTNKRTNVTNPEEWATYDDVISQCARTNRYSGIGFALSTTDDFAVIDLDKCVTADNEIEPWADAIIQRFDSYTELSPSGNGFKIWVRGVPPCDQRSKSIGDRGGKIEMFSEKRYLTVTGWAVWGCHETIQPRKEEFEALYAEISDTVPQVGTSVVKQADEWPTRDKDPLDDADILNRLFRGKKDGGKWKRIYKEGDTSAYDHDESRATAGLAWKLAYYCGKDGHEQLDRLMRESALMRSKWDEKRSDSTWGRNEVTKAINLCNEFLEPKQQKPKSTRGVKAGYACTDMGNGERFRDQYKNKVRYVPQRGKWVIWDGTRWCIDDLAAIYPLVKQTIRSIVQETESDFTDLLDWAKSSEHISRTKALLDAASKEPELVISVDQFDTNPWLLGCQNGTLDLKSGKLIQSRQEDYITKQAHVRYDATATCPLWIKTLEKLQPDPIMREYLQRALGYSLTGKTNEQCLHFLYGMGIKANGEAGNGANGKSTVIETFLELMGDYGLKTRIETFETPRQGNGSGASPDVFDLIGCRFLVGSEVGVSYQLNTKLIKDLTGGDTMSARPLYKESIRFHPNCKLWLYGNHKPNITETDEGIWRRVRLIDFPTYIEEKDRDYELMEKLKGELPGILNWAVEGCLLWQKQGRLFLPDQVRNSQKEYREEMDIVGTFLRECCIEEPECRTDNRNVFPAYQSWCDDNGFTRKLTKPALTRKLKERGYTTISHDGFPMWREFRLRLPSDVAPTVPVSIKKLFRTFTTTPAISTEGGSVQTE